MNKKSRRLTKLVSSLNNSIDNLIDLILNNKNCNQTSNIDQQFKNIDTILKAINFELSYLQLKNYGQN